MVNPLTYVSRLTNVQRINFKGGIRALFSYFYHAYPKPDLSLWELFVTDRLTSITKTHGMSKVHACWQPSGHIYGELDD
jgi:hypothetical protein